MKYEPSVFSLFNQAFLFMMAATRNALRPGPAKNLRQKLAALTLAWLAAVPALANLPGGGTGTGANVTLTDNGSTVTLANGIVSIVCTKSGATINQINYTYNNGGGTTTLQLLNGGTDGGQLYWETGGFDATASGYFSETSYTVVANPANTGGNYAEISMQSASATNGLLEVHFSLLRGSTGFYVTPIWSHRSVDGPEGMGETRDNIYAGSIFNWMCVDGQRNRLMEVSGGAANAVYGAPKEVSLWTSGIYQGRYEDKYKYSADLGVQRAWGWCSVGSGGKNVGLWNVSATAEYYNGGPMKRELMDHIGTTILNMLNGGHYGGGTDASWANGEVWTKVYGPYFIYCNNLTNTVTDATQASVALYADAQAQAAAEQTAWPYGWFTNANYTPASGRGAITGKMIIADSGNPNASAANLWVGAVLQPSTTDGVYDFQEWMKPYQFWVKSDTNGNFTIPNVIASNNYTLYAFGPGAPGTFMSQSQTGGNPPLIVNIASPAFAVNVTAGATNNLGNVTWTPSRVGATVFELGYPDRTARKFRHGDDWWVGDIGPSPTEPSPIWTKFLEYPYEFPSGPNYAVGQSRWSTDWDFIQPTVTDNAGNINASTSTITFTLANAPAGGSQASVFLATASDYQGPLIISVNNNNLGAITATATPNGESSTGYYPSYSGGNQESDASVREGIHGCFSDERITFAGSYLKQGQNTLTINMRNGGYGANHAMYDYLRLELTGYVPPPPAGVTAYPGNNCNLVCWPVTPGATSYNVLRSTTSTGTYTAVTNGVLGPVCGSGTNNDVWLDAAALNGTTYYYEVQSVNPTGTSASSPASGGAAPSAGLATGAPAAPTGLTAVVAGTLAVPGMGQVTLNWTASPGADYYQIQRSTVVNNGDGTNVILGTILLNNTNTTTSYVDATPNCGSLYLYAVSAVSAGGVSTNCQPVVVKPVPPAPTVAPGSLSVSFVQTTNVTLNWSAVPGAVGYLVSRATSSGGPFTLLQSITETTYTDIGLNASGTYFYRVTAVNAAGVSLTAANAVNGLQVAPAGLTAVGTNTQVILSWPTTTGATSYNVLRGTSSGGETTTVIGGYGNTSYTNTGLVNGTTYYYVVTATGSGGTSGYSPEASATPFLNSSGIWTAGASGNWGTAANWSGGAIAFGPGSTADFSTLSLPANLTVTLDSARTIGALKFGSGASAYDWALSGTNTLTLGTAPVIQVVNQAVTVSTVMAGTTGLTKTGLGALTLGGAAETFTGGLAVNAGNLTLDFTPTNSPTANLLPSANALALGGGGLQINGGTNAASSQTFAATTLNAGASVIAAAPVSGTGLPTVTLGAITANAGGMVEFIGPATIGAAGVAVPATGIITTAASGNSAFVGGNGTAAYDANFATVGLYDYAAAGTAAPYTVVGGSQVSGFYTTANGTAPAGGTLDVTGNITGWASQPYLTAMRFNTSIGANINVQPTYTGGSTITLNDILVTPNVGACNVNYPSGALRPAGGSSSYAGPYVIWQNNTLGELVLTATLGNSKVAGAAYVQAGPGTVWINGTGSGYTGPSYLNGGLTLIGGDGSLGAPATAAAVNLNGGTVLANGTFAMDNGGVNPRPFTLLGNGGGLAATAGGTLTVDGVIGGAAGAGPLIIGLPASGANGNVAGLVPGTGPGTANLTPVYATGTVVLNNANYYYGGTVLQSGTLTINGINALGGANYGGLTFNGGALQYAPALAGNGSGDLTSLGTAGVTLAAGGGLLDVNGNTVTWAGSVGNGGGGALTVKSSAANGMLVLAGANTYAGGTTITNVTLLANNAGGSATGAGGVSVLAGGILAGTGAVGGAVTVMLGGTLAPGNPLGTLTFNNDLTLAAGARMLVQVQHSPLTNSAVNVSGTLTAGGILQVINLDGTPLAAGDTFQVFNAANYSGSFANLALPALTTGLAWNTNNLGAGGTLSVVIATQPVISSVSISNGSLVFSGGAGVADASYYLLGSTNLTMPLTNWTPLLTNQFDGFGNFNATNLLPTNTPQGFFLLQVPPPPAP